MEASSTNHVVKVVERKNIIVSGVKRIISFDDKQFFMDTIMGELVIKGSSLEVIKLDTIDGNVSIKGNIDSFYYTLKDKESDSILAKLFK